MLTIDRLQFMAPACGMPESHPARIICTTNLYYRQYTSKIIINKPQAFQKKAVKNNNESIRN